MTRISNLTLGCVPVLAGLSTGRSNAVTHGHRPLLWALHSLKSKVLRCSCRMRLREDQRLLGSYCSDLVERHEDEVAAAIRGAKVDANGTLASLMCMGWGLRRYSV